MNSRRLGVAGFTLLELLTVMGIIIVLAALILGGVGYAQRRAATERARAEIAALSVALESYRVDHGDYPRNGEAGGAAGSNTLIPADPATGRLVASVDAYPASGVYMLACLEGDSTARRYFEPKTDMISTTMDRYLVDPFGNAYGYSTAETFNPTFDLWSCCGVTANDSTVSKDRPIWIRWMTNWWCTA